MDLSVVEWIGAIGALAGTLIVALRVRWGGWGFAVMLVFSGLLLVLAVWHERWPYAVLFAGYELVNLVGIYRWLVRPGNAA